MNLQVKTIIEEEWKEIAVLFTKHDESWHNGQTYQLENSLVKKEKRYFQFKTIIEKINQDYFIYEEIIKRNDKLFFISRLYDDDKTKVWESIIYFENNEIVQQLRHVSYRSFFGDVENNEELIKQESRNTTIIRTSFLDFIKNNTDKKQINNIEVETQEKYWIIKRLIWKLYHGFIFFLAWGGAISIIAKVIIAPLIVSLVSASVLTWLPFSIAGIIAGICVKQLYQNAKKLKKWLFPNAKDKYQLELEQKIEAQNNKIDSLATELHNLKDIYLNSNPQLIIQKKLLHCLQKNREINKVKTFKMLKKEFIISFRENKKVLADQSFEKSEANKSTVCANFFYKPKSTFLEFQECQKQVINLEKEANQIKSNGVTYIKDSREKSPVKTMKKMIF